MFKKLIVRVLLIVLSFMMMSATVFAETPAKEVEKNNAPPVIDNIGFIKNPPKELKEKFPMCDAFLKVEWIDKKYKIGYSHYEAKRKGEKKLMWALVTLLGDLPSYRWDVYQYKRQGRLKELFEIIKYGKAKGSLGVLVRTYKGEYVKIFNMELDDGALADNRCTVCIPYPDEEMVWIAEGKSVGQNYSETQFEELTNKVKKPGKPFNENWQKWLKSLWILDINFDGKKDFVLGRSLAATWQNKLYIVDSVYKDHGFQQTFPPNGRTCYVRSLGMPITTDGKNYYIGNQCNITELTSDSEKE
ncbi:MAG: hypothetical protein ABIK92_06210 [Pseudomonadota bacterium]